MADLHKKQCRNMTANENDAIKMQVFCPFQRSVKEIETGLLVTMQVWPKSWGQIISKSSLRGKKDNKESIFRDYV